MEREQHEILLGVIQSRLKRNVLIPHYLISVEPTRSGNYVPVCLQARGNSTRKKKGMVNREKLKRTFKTRL